MDELERALGMKFRDRALLDRAVTHRSFGSTNYERLEFLGDSALNCAIALLLVERFAQEPEGALSRMRAHLVRQETLVVIAERLGVSRKLKLGDGEVKNGGLTRPSILADVVEALIGACFLESGFDAALALVRRLYEPLWREVDPATYGKDAKTRLQEWCQARRLAVPQYDVIAVGGAAHQQTFDVRCSIPARSLTTVGRGASRRAAEQVCAASLLNQLEQVDQ